jgi:O-antigen/teichoic acid export membrane protein
VTMLAARVMPQSSFGTYKQLLMIAYFLFSFINTGLATSVSYYYKNLSPEKQRKLITNTFLISFLTSSITALGMIILGRIFTGQLNNNPLPAYLPLLAGYFFALNLFGFLDNLFVSAAQTTILGVANVIYSLIYCVLVGLIIYLKNNINDIIMTMTAVEILRASVLFVIYLKSHGMEVSIDRQFFKEQLTYCLPLGFANLLQSLNVYLDKILVSSYFTPEAYGVYANGAAEIPFVGWFTISVVTVALPIFSRMYNTDHNREGMFELWGRLTKNTAIILYPVFWILLFYAPGYIVFLYSHKFIASLPVFMIFLMKLPLACTVFSNILIVMNQKKYIIYNVVVGIIVNLGLNTIFIRQWGIVGASVAAVFTQFVLVTLQLILISRFGAVKITKVLPYLDLLRILFITGLVSSAVYPLSIFLNLGAVANLFIYGALTFFLSMVACLATGLIAFQGLMLKLKSRLIS